MEEIIRELKTRFPWLGTDRTADGGNTIEELSDWYDQILIRQKIDKGPRCPIDSEDLMRMFRSNFENGEILFLDWWAKYKEEYRLKEGSILPRNCPKCKEVINKLFMFEPREAKSWPMTVINGNDVVINWADTTIEAIEGEQSDFECPECNEVLFTDLNEANKWLLDPASIEMPKDNMQFFNVIRISRGDIASAFEEHANLAEAAFYLKDFEVQEIARKLADSILDNGDYHIALEIISEEYLEEAYEQNKEEILKRAFGGLMTCPECGMNPNDGQSEEQQAWELQHVREHGICSACKLENDHELTITTVTTSLENIEPKAAQDNEPRDQQSEKAPEEVK